MGDIGVSVQDLNTSIRNMSSTVSNSVKMTEEKVSNTVSYSNAFMVVRDILKKRKANKEVK